MKLIYFRNLQSCYTKFKKNKVKELERKDRRLEDWDKEGKKERKDETIKLKIKDEKKG